MKTKLPYLMGLTCLLIFLNSFTTSKNSIDQQKPEIENPKGETACFVQMNDGSIKNFSSLQLVTGVFKTPHLLADGNVIITAAEIKAYQDKDHYAVSQKEIAAPTRPSYVAVDALPGFAVRIAKGKLNVYTLKYYNGHNTTEKYFLQAGGDDAPIVAYTPELLNDLVKDNTEAYTFFNKKNKIAILPKKLLLAVEIYNNSSRDISKN
jgi:hypothetical protein